MRGRIGAVLLVLGALAFATEAQAQKAQPGIDLASRANLFRPLSFQADSAATAAVFPQQSAQPVVEEKHFWLAAGEVVAVNLGVWGFNRIGDAFDITPEGDSVYWSRISPASMLSNLQEGWVWDDNAFSNNQIAHPYHGSLYYNAGRSNGYSYWQSAGFATAGSWMWEYLMETHNPAPNDWATTVLGGIALGEMLYRFSSLVLNNHATGTSRFFRELGATALSPIRGLNRGLRGQWNDVGENPDDWRTDFIRARFDLGVRSVTDSVQIEGDDYRENFVIFGFEVDYGDPHDVPIDRPFDFFELRGALVSNEVKPVTSLFVTGLLTRWDLRNTDRSDLRLGILHDYTYINSKFFESGNQAFGAGLLWRRHTGQRSELRARLNVSVIALGAISSEYAEVVGRSYDYGPGAGWGLQASWEHRNREIVKLEYDSWFIHTVNGAQGGEHIASIVTLRGVLPIFRGFGLGAEVGVVQRNSYYKDLEDTNQRTEFGKLFVSFMTK